MRGAVRPGLGPLEVAVVLRNLMQRLGHSQYYVQGGDWGHFIGSNLATLFPTEVLGFHTNMPIVASHPLVPVVTIFGMFFPSLVVEPELHSRMYPWGQKLAFTVEETGYLHEQATKPDTVGVALTDSPAGLAAYILEKFSTWTNPAFKKAGDGELLNKFALTHLLDNVMIYWATNSITTSMRLYAEHFSKRYMEHKMDQVHTTVPTWGIKFKHELGFQPDCILKLKYKNYLHSTIVEDGGHFAAFELPDVMADDIFKAVNTFIEFHEQKKKEAAENPIDPEPHKKAITVYDFTVKDINGNDVKLDKYKGHVLIIVNVASQCGLTSTNYQELNALYDKYAKSRGLRILAFPCNQFLGQEPGTAKDILTFTKDRGVKFDLFEKVDVNGDTAHPLWKFLKQTQSGTFGDFIKWNFSKFIVDKNGVPVERLAPNVNPSELEPLLAKYW
ncbi:unnamed protein product [Plutella xylostella]|uniref:Glutathione peroxidase n=1 Tax=Plutella xylostella TaxID=51655 RepID=A0A8S4F6E3_PLUXY|nr:unnamed protein product [Plutella xylostella]